MPTEYILPQRALCTHGKSFWLSAELFMMLWLYHLDPMVKDFRKSKVCIQIKPFRIKGSM